MDAFAPSSDEAHHLSNLDLPPPVKNTVKETK